MTGLIFVAHKKTLSPSQKKIPTDAPQSLFICENIASPVGVWIFSSGQQHSYVLQMPVFIALKLRRVFQIDFSPLA